MISDETVEKALRAYVNDPGDNPRTSMRAALEAAEPYLTAPQIHIESGLRQAVECLLAAYNDVHRGKVCAAGSLERAYYVVSVDLQNALNRNPEVKS